ncbi:MAG: hypothetical protein AAFR21_19035, partial [Pseudomonadota bacterium]
MGTGSTFARNFKIGRKVLSPVGIAFAATRINSELQSDDPDGVQIVLDVTSIVTSIAGTAKFVIDELRETEKKKLEPVILA